MSNTQPHKVKTTRSHTVTTWATNAGSNTRKASPVERVETPTTEKKLYMSSDSRSIIEDCLFNGVIQQGAKISFPLYLYQQTPIRSKTGKNIILADTSSGEDFEVKLIRFYTRDEWSAHMAVGNMAPVILPGQGKPMDYGCQIEIIKRL